MIDHDEPVECLWTGDVALRAIVQIVQRLQSRGHTNTVDVDTRVHITPADPDDVWFVLDSCWRDTEAAFEASALDVNSPSGGS